MMPAKIILAGEYTILDQSQLIGVPFMKYSGQWKQNNSIDQRLVNLCAFLEENHSHSIDVIRLRKDILSGFHFESNIPEGYGCGSSGAVVAGIAQQYLKRDLDDPIKTFSEIEAFFHGTSSGLDPFISYLKQPVHIKDGKIRTLNKHAIDLSHFYLFDSGHSRSTKNLVEKYKLLSTTIKSEIIAKTNHLVDSLISKNKVVDNIKALSRIQLDQMKFAIPKNIQLLWESSYNNKRYFKLCGAGGGGFFLVFSEEEINEPHYIPMI